MTRIALVVLATFFLPVLAYAHALGASYEAWIDGYHIDIGYNSPAPTVGESVIFDFNFAVTATNTPAYTDVWVRIDDPNGAVVLATALYNTEFGGPRMSYAFPRVGTYTISARYENGSDPIVSASFPMTVIPDSYQRSFLGKIGGTETLVALGVGLLLGALGLYVVRNRRSLMAVLPWRHD